MGIARILLAIAVVLVGGGGVFTATNVEDEDERFSLPTVTASPPRVTVSYQPAPGATPVSPTSSVSVRATDGQLREVTLTPAGGAPLRATLSSDRRSATVAGPLDYATNYTWSGVAADSDGKTVPVAGGFATVRPAKQVRGTLNLRDGRTVGIAAPIQLQSTGTSRTGPRWSARSR